MKKMVSIPTIPLSMPFDDVSEDVFAHYEAERLSTTEKGGAGSGHFGHAGRPGERGGSLPAGGNISESTQVYQPALSGTGVEGYKPITSVQYFPHPIYQSEAHRGNREMLGAIYERCYLSTDRLRDPRSEDEEISELYFEEVINTDNVRKNMKANIAFNLTERLKNEYPDADWTEDKVSKAIELWTVTAGDNNSKALAMQGAFRDMLKLDSNEFMDDKIRDAKHEISVYQDVFQNERKEINAFLEEFPQYKMYFEQDKKSWGSNDPITVCRYEDQFMLHLESDSAGTAGYHKMRDSVYLYSEKAFKHAAAKNKSFKTGFESSIRRISEMHPSSSTASQMLVADRLRNQLGYLSYDMYLQLAKTIYKNTQDYLIGYGFDPDDTIRLFRGVTPDKTKPMGGLKNAIGEIIKWDANPVESWTTDINVAWDTFAGFDGYVLEVQAPIKNIISSCFSGMGCLPEQEFIIGSSKNIEAKLYHVGDYGEKPQQSKEIIFK